MVVDNLSCVRGGRALFEQLSFTLQPGQALQVVGENGVGKTTLLKALVGLLAPQSGMIEKPQDLSLFYFGHKLALKDRLSILENLKFSLPQFNQAEAEKILAQLNLSDLKNQWVGKLSQGQKQKVVWAKLLLSNAKLWVLDEPFAAIDQATLPLLWQLIEAHLQQQGMVLFTSHSTEHRYPVLTLTGVTD